MNWRLNSNHWKTACVIFLMIATFAGLPATYANDLDRARETSAARHTELALNHQKLGRLQHALREWQIVDALTTGDTARQQIAELQLIIKARSASLLLKADDALKAGEEKQAKRISLAVLALDPDNAAARNNVRLIESGRSLVELSVNTERELAKKEPRTHAISSKVDVRSLPVVRRKSTDTGTTTETNSNSTTLKLVTTEQTEPKNRSDVERTHRQTLAERHFRRGVELFLNNRSEAIAEFDRTLALNPGHMLARRYRSTALKLQ